MPSILILGHVSDTPRNSVEVLTRSLGRAFERLGNWEVTVRDVREAKRLTTKFDVVLVHTWGNLFIRFAPMIRAAGRITASFMEVPFSCNVRFVMLPMVAERTGSISTPFPMPDVLANAPMTVDTNQPPVILLDHSWPPNLKAENLEWWKVLEPTISELVGACEVKQLVRWGEGNDPHTLPWAKLLHPMPYEEYLGATQDVTHYVMTHAGTYNMTTLDMAARGKVCIAPHRIGLHDHFDPAGLGL